MLEYVFFAKSDRQIVKGGYDMYPLDYASQYLIPGNLYYKLDFFFRKDPRRLINLFNISSYEYPAIIS